MGLTFNLKKKDNKIIKQKGNERGGREQQIGESLISSIPEFLTVGFRWIKHEKCSTRRGLRVGTKNTGFHREFR